MLYFVSASVAVTAGLLVLLVGAALPARSRSVRQRMMELGLDGSSSVADRARRERRKSRVKEMLELLGDWATRDSPDSRATRRALVRAGYRQSSAPAVYLGIRICAGVCLAVAAVVLGIALELPAALLPFAALWGAGGGWIVPRFVLSRMVQQRQKQIQRALPDALDLLVICVEAGLGLNQALVRVATEIRHVSEVLTEEIGLTNLQIRAGTPREEALMGMAERTGVKDVRSLVTMLVQTERFGTSIARSLRVHADTLRTKRRQRAEEAAAKTTIKIIFPLGFCIFPALFVVILGPALIQVFRALSGF